MLSLGSPLSDTPAISVGYPAGAHEPLPLPLHQITTVNRQYGYDIGGAGEDYDKKVVIAADPGLQFTRETWWDALLFLYASDDGIQLSSDMVPPTSSGMREATAARVMADLRFIFRASPHWLHFINLPRFFGSLLDPHARHSTQPSLILGALALSTFFRSREGELGSRGRDRAMSLRDQAQSALEASLNSRWVDHGLVQAAWVSGYLLFLVAAANRR